MEQQFDETDEQVGIRFNVNVFPSTRLEASKIVTPVGCLFTPLHLGGDFVGLDLGHLPQCSTCQGAINPFVKVDRANRMWECQFCDNKSFLPETYSFEDLEKEVEMVKGGPWGKSWISQSSLLPEATDATTANTEFAFVYVIDLYQHIEGAGDGGQDFEILKKSIIHSISLVPNGCAVGIVTFDEDVHVYRCEQGTSSLSIGPQRILDSRRTGSRFSRFEDLFETKTVGGTLELLGVNATKSEKFETSWLHQKKFLVRLSDSNRDEVTETISNIKPRFTNNHKALRSTGLAVYITSLLLSQASFTGFLGKVNVFLSGPCTTGPGQIVKDSPANSTLRSHTDILDMKAPETILALKFNRGLSYLACGLSTDNVYSILVSLSKKTTDFFIPDNRPQWSFDIYACSVDQTGVYEMASLALNTMGKILLCESYSNTQFAEFLFNQSRTVYESQCGHKAKVTVLTSQGLRVSKMVSNGFHLTSSYQAETLSSMHHDKISDTLTEFDSHLKKNYFTNQWSFVQLSSVDTIAIFLEPRTYGSYKSVPSGSKDVFLQFKTKFLDLQQEKWKSRVVTLKKPTTASIFSFIRESSNGPSQLVEYTSTILREKYFTDSFDQKTWLSLLAHLLLGNVDTEVGYEDFLNIEEEILKALASVMYNLGGFFSGPYHPNKAANPYDWNPHNKSKLYLHDNFRMLPELAFCLTKSPQLAKIFNCSPDETAYYHHWLFKSNCRIFYTMIRPKLYQVDATSTQEVTLSHKSLSSKVPSYFILNSFFEVVIYYNYDIRENKSPFKLHHSNNEHIIRDSEHIEAHLKGPINFINGKILADIATFVPKYVLTQTNHSQSRYLFARINSLSLDQHEAVIETTKSDRARSSPKSFLNSFKKILNLDHSKSSSTHTSFDGFLQELKERLRNYQRR